MPCLTSLTRIRAQQWILCDDETTTKIRPMTTLPVMQGSGTTSNEAILIEDPIEDDNDADELNLKRSVKLVAFEYCDSNNL
jgi:hypothetical protein